jgi:hypothetical protein
MFFFPVCLLDGAIPVADALRRLEINSDVERAVVRRQEGASVHWYVFERTTIRDLLYKASDDVLLGAVQDIPWFITHVDRVLQLDRSGSTESMEAGLLFDGERPIGWLEVASVPDVGAWPPPLDDGSYRHWKRVRRGTELVKQALTDYVHGFGNHVRSVFKDRSAAKPAITDAHIPASSPGEGTGQSRGQVFESYPVIDLPEFVEPETEFVIRVGVSATPAAGVEGAPLHVSGFPEETRSIELDVQVTAYGFTIAGGAGARYRLTVPLADPEVAIEFSGNAAELRSGEEVRLAWIRVQYSYGGVPCGFARRRFEVRREGPDPVDLAPQSRAAFPFSLPSGSAPDLTVAVVQADLNFAGEGKYRWLFDSPHPIGIPSDPPETRLGSSYDAQTFAKFLISQIERDDGRDQIRINLDGIATEIRWRMPNEFWSVLGEVAAHVKPLGRTPSLLLLTEDPYVPWELASVASDSVLDEGYPAFLGAQVNVGRWILPENQRPPPPYDAVNVRTIAVVTGEYDSKHSHRGLPHAVEEGNHLRDEYGAVPLSMTVAEVERLLRGELEQDSRPVIPELIHFACHGEVNTDNPLFDRLVLQTNKDFLHAVAFSGAKIGEMSGPFVFFNACQVGAARQVLGQYSGFVGSCLRNRFRGFLAPLWTVRDDIAKRVAANFYNRVLGSKDQPGIKVSELLREVRKEYNPLESPTSTTPLAYIFYGHPDLVITFDRPDDPARP